MQFAHKFEFDGKWYEFLFPNNARDNELQKLLEIDLYKDADKLTDDPFYAVRKLDTAEKTEQALTIMLGAEIAKELTPQLTKPELSAVVLYFFGPTLKSRVKINEELKRSPGSTKLDRAKSRMDTPLK